MRFKEPGEERAKPAMPSSIEGRSRFRDDVGCARPMPRPSDDRSSLRAFDARVPALAFVVLALSPGCDPREGAPADVPSSPDFATRREHALPAKPTALLAADLDGDGRDELVATDAERGEAFVWRGGATGPSEAARRAGRRLAVERTTLAADAEIAAASHARSCSRRARIRARCASPTSTRTAPSTSRSSRTTRRKELDRL